METQSPVAACTAVRIRYAVSVSGSCPYSASVPPMSPYHSSMLAASTTGMKRVSTA